MIEGARSLAESLKMNSTLTHLDLRGKFVYLLNIFSQFEIDTCIGKEGFSFLEEALKINSTLVISPCDCMQCARWLRRNRAF